MIKSWPDFRILALDLLELGYIPIFDYFNPELKEVVVECILRAMKKDKKALTFLIDSGGGQDDCFRAIKGTMSASGITFTGLVTSKAGSNAFRLLNICHLRQAMNDAYIVFHWGETSIGNAEIAAIFDGEAWPVENILSWRRPFLNEVHERSGLAIDTLKHFAVTERPIYAEEALRLNMIDKIVNSLPNSVAAKARNK